MGLVYLVKHSNQILSFKEVSVKAHETAIAHPNDLHRLEPASDHLKFEIHLFCLSNSLKK